MKKATKSKLSPLIELDMNAKVNKGIEDFKTIVDAITEIKFLREENYRLRLVNAMLTYKRPRGRPKKQAPNTGGLFGSLIPYALGGKKPKKTGGRPVKYPDMLQKIAEWDIARLKIAKILGKTTISDKKAFEWIILNHGDDPASRTSKEHTKDFLNTIGYFRDQTCMRIRQNKKRKTPAKNRSI